MNIKPYLHAVAGGVVAAALVAEPLRSNGITTDEWFAILSAFVSGTGLTKYKIPGPIGKVEAIAQKVAHATETPGPDYSPPPLSVDQQAAAAAQAPISDTSTTEQKG